MIYKFRIILDLEEDVFRDIEVEGNLIYVYDFFSMWTFFVELAEIAEKEDGAIYPNLLYVHGQLPDAPPVKKFEAEDLSEDEDNMDDDYDLDNLDDFNFDEHWN